MSEFEYKNIISVDVKTSVENLKMLRQELKEAKGAMLTVEEGTDAYNDALARAAEITHRLRETNERVRASAMDFGQVLGNVSKVAGGLMGGFNALQGVMTLMGSENQDLQKAFVKLQAGMAIVQGLSGIDGMIKGFQSLGTVLKNSGLAVKVMTALQWLWNAALSASPIFLLAAVIAAVVAPMALFAATSKEASVQQNALNTSIDGTAFATKEAVNAHNEHVWKLQELQDEYDKVVGKLDEYEASIKKINREYEKQTVAIQQEYEEQLKDAESFWSTKLGKVLKYTSAAYYVAKYYQEKETEAVVAATKKRDDQLKKLEEEKRARERLEDGKKQQKERERAQKQADEANKKAQADLDAYNKAEAALLEAQIKWQNRIIEERRRMQAQMRADRDAEYESDRQHRLTHLAVERAEMEQRIELERLESEEKKRILEVENQHREQMYSATASLAGAMSELVGKETGLGKALAVAATTISTYQAAQQAYASAFMPFPTAASPALGAISAAAAIASGLANVRSILKVKLPKGDRGGGGGAQPSAPRISVPNAPNVGERVGMFRNVNTPAEIALQKQPMRAYVVESDITGTQKRIQTIRDEATFS